MVWIGVLTLVCVTLSAESRATERPESVLAPRFNLERLDGAWLTLESLRGQIVIVDFWATWCLPCKVQIPELNRYISSLNEAAREEVVLLGVSVDVEGRDVVADYVQRVTMSYPVLLGDEALARRYGAPGFPTLAVIDAQGRLASMHVGLIDRAALLRLVDAAR